MYRYIFTLRDLFWLTLVVAMALGWWVREAAAETHLQAVKAALAGMGCVVVVTAEGEVTIRYNPM